MFSLNVSGAASDKLAELISEEESDLYLRVFATGGGCSGMQYGLTFEDDAMADDEIYHVGNVKFLVDQISSIYLNGANIDYKEELLGSNFVITCDTVKTSCGCGSSV